MKIIPIPNLMALSGIVEIFQIKTMILKRHDPTFLHGGASEIQGIDSSHHFEKLQGRSSNSEPITSKQFFRSF
jgi:hypothetical protein